MDKIQVHRGIRYSVVSLGAGYWEWQVLPPGDVQGLYTIRGKTIGKRDAAEVAARRMIDLQDQGMRSLTKASYSGHFD